HAHRGTNVDGTTDVKAAAVIGDDALDDRQSETAAVRDEVASAEEPARDVLAARGDGHRLRRRRVANGVVDEVVEHQAHGRAIGAHQRDVGRNVDLRLEPGLGEL